MRFCSYFLLTSLFFLILFTPFTLAASTKRQALLDYLETLQVDDSGFRPASNQIENLEATADALMLYLYLGSTVEKGDELIYYIQRCQSENGGFGASPGFSPSLLMTYHAIRAIQGIGLNESWIDGNIDRWKILNFTLTSFNETYGEIIFPAPTDHLWNCTIEGLDALYQLFYISSFFDSIPSFNFTYVTCSLKELQYDNGSYPSFDLATRSLRLIYLINDLYHGMLSLSPNSIEGAISFIKAFKEEDGGYSNTITTSPTLESSYYATTTLSILDPSFKDSLTTSFILDHQSYSGGFNFNNEDPSIKASWLAVVSVAYLNELNELNAPNIPQTEGFVSFPSFFVLFFISVIIIQKKVKKGKKDKA